MTSSPHHPDPAAGAPRLGVGLLYNRALAEFLQHELDGIDFVEFIPDLLRTDHGLHANPRFKGIAEQIAFMDWVAARRPVIAHSIGLSIGSAGLFDTDYVAELARWQDRYRFPWHSEHLSFARVPDAEGEHHAAIALPVPYDAEVLDLLATRVRAVQRSVAAPLLLENNVYFAAISEQEMTESEFLNALCAKTGCGLLLDLHNLYANARNHNLDMTEFLARLDLSHVVELHASGGNELEGMYMDSHSGPCPPEVWTALEVLLPRLPNLRAITFEFDESYCPEIGAEGLRAHLARARALWARCGL